MPPWGRPPGGRQGKKAQRGWDNYQSSNEPRFEEVEDSEDEDWQGVELDLGAPQKRLISDELHFTGVDLGSSRPRRRKGNAYDEDSESSDDEGQDDLQQPEAQQMQLMIREKEDYLVDRALERIQRARAMGKPNVKLSQAEMDALERAEQAQDTPEKAKNTKKKKAIATRPKAEDRRRSKSDKPTSSRTPPMKALEPRRKSKASSREDPQVQPLYPMQPSAPYPPSPGAMMYPPQGYYPVPSPPVPQQRPASSSSRTGSRTASSQSLRAQLQHPHTPPMPPYFHPYHPAAPAPGPPGLGQARYFSNPDPSYPGMHYPEPSDPNWEPRSRSASNLVPYPIDQPYPPGPSYPQFSGPGTGTPPHFDPRDPRFMGMPPGGQRVMSGPPDLYGMRGHPQPGPPHPQDPYGYSRGQGQVQGQRGSPQTFGDGIEVEEDDDDDDGSGGDDRMDSDYVEPRRGPQRAGPGAGNVAVAKRGKRGR